MLLQEISVLIKNYFRCIREQVNIISNTLLHWFHLQFLRHTNYVLAVSTKEQLTAMVQIYFHYTANYLNKHIAFQLYNVLAC